MLLTAWQALRGQPFAEPDVVTLSAVGAIVGAVVVAVAAVAVSARRREVAV
ncbi:hypothetical protein ACFQX7_40325 [Luedemannella flava]